MFVTFCSYLFITESKKKENYHRVENKLIN